jgi:polyphosphate kinase
LIVRGICGLRPGLRGVSSRIRVRSIVGRFLEHSRIFYFANGGEEEVYLGSADWMPRNLYERVEVTFPVQDAMQRQRIRTEILEAYLGDTAKARLLRGDGSYVRPKLPAGAGGFNAQEFLIAVAEGRQNASDIPAVSRPSVRTRRKAGNLA